MWIYPGISANYKEDLVGFTNISLTTLSLSPKIFMLNNVLSAQECEELRRIGEEETARAGIDLYTLTAQKSPLVHDIQSRISSLLKIPIELAFTTYGMSHLHISAIPLFSLINFFVVGLEITHHLPAKPGKVLIQPKRDFTLKPDSEHVRKELDRGRNTLVSVSHPSARPSFTKQSAHSFLCPRSGNLLPPVDPRWGIIFPYDL